jgi:tetratricopeptide (TPR) repeat protein
MKKTLFLLVVAALAFLRLSAQSTDQQTRSAFQKSYELEAAGLFGKAIESLTALKDEGYEVNLRLGWLNYLLKQYGESAACYRKAVKIKNSSIDLEISNEPSSLLLIKSSNEIGKTKVPPICFLAFIYFSLYFKYFSL